jgi:hypothetical protein
MFFDPSTRRLIVFGGGYRDGSIVLNDIWAYEPSANTWTNLNPSGTLPPKRAAQSIVYDQVTHRFGMFGGWNGDSILNDTWVYDP